jgi:hypothetical protein
MIRLDTWRLDERARTAAGVTETVRIASGVAEEFLDFERYRPL